MNNFGKQRTAQLLAAGLNVTQVRVGDSSAAPAPEQTGLSGDTVGTGSGALTVAGTHVRFQAAIPLSANEIVGEAGLFDVDGNMIDRWVFGPLATASAGSLVPIWDLEVL